MLPPSDFLDPLTFKEPTGPQRPITQWEGKFKLYDNNSNIEYSDLNMVLHDNSFYLTFPEEATGIFMDNSWDILIQDSDNEYTMTLPVLYNFEYGSLILRVETDNDFMSIYTDNISKIIYAYNNPGTEIPDLLVAGPGSKVSAYYQQGPPDQHNELQRLEVWLLTQE